MYMQGTLLDSLDFCLYKTGMGKKRGRPRVDPGTAKAVHLDIRLEVDEKQAFKDAADLAGLGLSAWIRERLRRMARKELSEAGRPVAFMGGTQSLPASRATR
jgi:hypothetical protein